MFSMEGAANNIHPWIGQGIALLPNGARKAGLLWLAFRGGAGEERWLIKINPKP
jgi:hypothetical protein